MVRLPKYPFCLASIPVYLIWSNESDGGEFIADLPTTYSRLSGTCNTNMLYSRVGDQRPMYFNYGCMTGTPSTWYRELLTSKR
jgi:hypothetical protein